MTGISRHNNSANRESTVDRPAYKQSVPADSKDGLADNISGQPDNRPAEAEPDR